MNIEPALDSTGKPVEGLRLRETENRPGSLTVAGDGRLKGIRPRVSVLVVEDGIIVGEDLRRRLEALGYRVPGIVQSGEEALKAAKACRPDVVLMDIRLHGGMDGIDAADQIRRVLDIPVIFATAYSDDATLQRAMLAAPYGFIIKPVEARELRSTIELALHRHADDRKVREREARYRTIVESSPDAILLTDTDGKLMECNPQAAELFGVATPAGMIGRCLFDLLLPDDRDRARAAHRSVAPNGSRQWADYEFLREDGGRFPGEMSARPAFDTTHPPQGVIVIVRDITQRRRTEGTLRDALNRKDILLKEVNHRVHNHLSMLSRLLNLQARDIEDARAADLLRESRNRLKSIELMHSQILQSADLSAISMREYIRRLAALLYRSYGTHASTVSLTVDVDHICIGPDKALPCGIIINELLTNALRHAFPGKRKGEVNVRLHPNRGGTIQLEVRDNGIGIPNRAMLDRADTFGMTIIRLLTEQLHGTISVDRHEGTIFTVTIPV